MSHFSRALPYQLQHRARWAELSIPLTVRTAFEQRTLGHRPGVLLFGWNNRPECPLSTQSGHRNAPTDGWARRVASLTAAHCVQAPNSKPSVARMMNCAPIEATRNFRRTPAGNRAVGPSVDVCYQRGPVSRFNNSRLFWPRWRHPLLQLGRSRSAEEQRRRFQVSVPPRRPSQRHNPPPT